MKVASLPCPCTPTKTYAECCQPLHNDQIQAASALRLMQSRYSAFALQKTAYLIKTWHPNHRPKDLTLDSKTKWLSLEIISKNAGEVFDNTGIVEFKAHFSQRGKKSFIHEKSEFKKVAGKWLYTCALN
jgi:SEC-C motif-containing protein